MKYLELVQIEPIASSVQLRYADRAEEQERLVSSFILSEQMAERLRVLVFPNLRLDRLVEAQGVLIIGNQGAGKSHLLSVLSLVAQHAALAQSLAYPGIAEAASSIVGKFKVLRIESGSARTGFPSLVCAQLETGLAGWDVHYRFPAPTTPASYQPCFAEMMTEFHRRFPAEGLLLVIDDLPDGLCAPASRAAARDRAFLEDLGEACGRLNLRLLAGCRELRAYHRAPSPGSPPAARDHFVQVPIPQNDVRLLVATRLLKKTPEQMAMIREHLTPFARSYANMSERMEEFVAMFPVHPDYLDLIGRIPYVHTREIIRTLSDAVKKLLHETVPTDRVGLIAYDSYWDTICTDPVLRALPEIEAVTEYNRLVKEKIMQSFAQPELRDMALRLVHALSVHRLTTDNIYSQHGATPAELRDTLCLHLSGIEAMGGAPADDLLLQVEGVLDVVVHKSFRRQLLSRDPETGEYFLHLKKFKRFVKPELVLHWVNAIPFLFLLVSGGMMVAARFLHLDSARFNAIVAFHKTCATCWAVLVPLTVLMRPRLHWLHVRPMLKWGTEDLVWMVQSLRSLVDKKAVIPPAARFNTGQKMNACLVMLYFFGFTATGILMIWRGPILLPWYIHTSLFLVALGSASGHLFLALINPSTRIALAGIFHGWSPMKYVRHHHPLSLPRSLRAHHDHGHVSAKMILEELRPHRKRFLVLATTLGVTAATAIVLNQSRVVFFKHVFVRTFSKFISPRDLSPKHHLGVTGESCAHCHSYAGGVPDTNCEHCHAEIVQRRVNLVGYHGQFKGHCAQCHKEHPTPSRLFVPLKKDKFDHNLATFKRDGKHAQVACDECHARKRTPGTPGIYYLGLKHDSCTDCHRDQHQGQMKAACESCHSPKGWSGDALKFTHDTGSTFKLVGKHATVACAKCHKPCGPKASLSGAMFKGLPDKCSSCHKEPHGMQFAAECNSCHSPEGWDRGHLSFDHNRDSRFPLMENHAAVACDKCHTPAAAGEPLGFARFRGLKSECADCHKDPHQGQLGRACISCHQKPVPWSMARLRFDHNNGDSRFPLQEKHSTVACDKCHTPAIPGEHLGFARFRGLKSECADCHKDPHQGQFARACTSCHLKPVPWSVARLRFDHNRDSPFQLREKHASVDCIKCHKPPKPDGGLGTAKFKGLGNGCADCHKVEHPPQYGATCMACHTVRGWARKRPGFEHIFNVRVAGENLSGKHLTAKCNACHDGVKIAPLGLAQRTDYQCQTCHEKDEPHDAALGKDCFKCHTTDGWKGNDLRFNHDAMARFALDQAHRGVACTKCHENGHWKPLDTKCESCHSKTFLEKTK